LTRRRRASAGSSGLKAYKFSYVGRERIETIPWYRYDLRRFIYRNWGRAIWFMGSIGTREAYLIVEPELEEEVWELAEPLELGGRFRFTELQLSEDGVRRLAGRKPVKLGYLKRLDLGERIPDGLSVSPSTLSLVSQPRVRAVAMALLGGVTFAMNPLPHYHGEPAYIRVGRIKGLLKVGRKLVVFGEKVLVKPLNPDHEEKTYERLDFTIPLFYPEEAILDDWALILCKRRIGKRDLEVVA